MRVNHTVHTNSFSNLENDHQLLNWFYCILRSRRVFHIILKILKRNANDSELFQTSN